MVTNNPDLQFSLTSKEGKEIWLNKNQCRDLFIVAGMEQLLRSLVRRIKPLFPLRLRAGNASPETHSAGQPVLLHVVVERVADVRGGEFAETGDEVIVRGDPVLGHDAADFAGNLESMLLGVSVKGPRGKSRSGLADSLGKESGGDIGEKEMSDGGAACRLSKDCHPERKFVLLVL